MDKEKFVGRINIMLYETCSCNKEESIEILEECLRRLKVCKNFPEDLRLKVNKIRLKQVESWADYVKTHSDKDWSKIQNAVVNKELRKLKIKIKK